MYGDGVVGLEEKITVECTAMVKMLEEKKQEEVNVCAMMEHSVSNVICNVLFGNRYEPSDPEFATVTKFNHFIFNLPFRTDLAIVCPWTQRFYHSTDFQNYLDGLDMRDKYISKRLQEHEDTLDTQRIRDVCDSLLKSLREESDERWKEIGSKSDVKNNLVVTLADMFVAGFETVATNLTWGILYLLHHPQIQEELFEEIARVLGKGSTPTLKDRAELPLCRAFINETLRLASAAPIVLHKSTQDSSVDGKPIPMGTQLMFNIYSANHDQREWKDPEEFNHRRWLDADGKCVSALNKSFFPFGAGKRSCLGEQMAMSELFLFLTTLVAKFQIQPNEVEGFPIYDVGFVGFTYASNPYTAKFVPRRE